MDDDMRITKHRVTVVCPWCSAGSTMTWSDDHDEYCMACKKNLKTGKEMEK
jgi:hypothetical protein